jgi:hypothetical protein
MGSGLYDSKFSCSLYLPCFYFSLNALEKQEQRALENAEKKIATLNFSVSPDIQTLFDRLNFMYVLIFVIILFYIKKFVYSRYPCHWQGDSIVILSEYIISPPYETVTLDRNSKTTVDSAGFERVVKVVS